MTLTPNITETSSDRVTHSVVMVDATLAARWLTRNTLNRPVRTTMVTRYARDMVEGRWTFAADPIRFAAGGDLIDGQHRLHAIVEAANVTVPMLVVRGLPAESQGVMDQGSKRTAADQLTLRGHKHTTLLASAVRQHLAWKNGYLFRDTKVANAEITTPWVEQWVGAHSGEVAFLCDHANLITRTDAPPSAAGAAAIAFYRIDPESAAEFFHLLSTGAGTEGHPIVTLDKRLARLRREQLRMPTRDYVAMFVQAWNAWREGRQMFKFQRPRGGSWSAANFPEPR